MPSYSTSSSRQIRERFSAWRTRTQERDAGSPLLSALPEGYSVGGGYYAEIVREGDVGTPTVITRAGSHAAAGFDRIAQRVGEALGWRRIAAIP